MVTRGMMVRLHLRRIKVVSVVRCLAGGHEIKEVHETPVSRSSGGVMVLPLRQYL